MIGRNMLVLVLFITIVSATYNPIPMGCVIVSTVNQIFIMEPIEYGGSDQFSVIFTATDNMTIINTIYDSTVRVLYIVFTKNSDGKVYLSPLLHRERLAPVTYQLPITFSTLYMANFSSLTSNVFNRRAFYTDQTGTVSMYSMSGLMSTVLIIPPTISNTVRLVEFADTLNKLFVVTDKTVDACMNLDTNNLQCCRSPLQLTELRAMTFDVQSNSISAYVVDQKTGFYEVILNASGCPTNFRFINTVPLDRSSHVIVDRGLYFVSGSSGNLMNNSKLAISNGSATARVINVGSSIVALHISYPDTTKVSTTVETCFHGITLNDYRVAVILAAIFGTIMGILVCFNVLFCMDFFMTKSIIRSLKKQIPQNLLEDQWNKLIEEKYAKLASEKQKENEKPPEKRRSSIFARQPTTSIPASSGVTTQSAVSNESDSERRPSVGVVPKISDYIRRRSESYFNRRQSTEDQMRLDPTRSEFTAVNFTSSRKPSTPSQTANVSEVTDEQTSRRGGLRTILSGQELVKLDADFL